MPSPFEQFIDIAKENNVDETLLKSNLSQAALNKLEVIGENLGEKAQEWIKKGPKKPNGPTPTLEESAFPPKHKNETSLYQVTNRENEVPFVEKTSKLFKNLNYKVQGFNVKTSLTKENKEYSVLAGEKMGIGLEKKSGSSKNSLQGYVNIGNSKIAIEYNSQTLANSYKVSVFNQGKNVGLYAGYKNKEGLNSAFAVDNNSASISCSYDKNYKRCKLNVGGYATTGDNYSNPFIGVNGRITF